MLSRPENHGFKLRERDYLSYSLLRWFLEGKELESFYTVNVSITLGNLLISIILQVNSRKGYRKTPIKRRKMGPKTCEVCDDAQSKYKCPTCLVPYCSLLCFKKHKEVPCAKLEPSSKEQLPAAPPTGLEKVYYVDEPSEVLQQLQLESIASSTEIREALKDEELKKLLYNIDSSAAAETELDKAMEVEVFRIFSEKILSGIGS